MLQNIYLFSDSAMKDVHASFSMGSVHKSAVE